MSDATAKLQQVIDRYLAGGQPFMEFHETFMNLYIDALSDAEALAFEPAYDLVYMGGDGDVSSEDQAEGLLSESVLKSRLREFQQQRLDQGPT